MNLQDLLIKKLTNQDTLIFRKLILLFKEVFEAEDRSTPDEAWLNVLLNNQAFIAYVILYQNEPVAGLTAYELPMYYARNAEIFVYDIAVKPEFQRQGLGRMLLEAIRTYGKQKGIQEIFVAAHESDIHALDFYHASGGKAEKVVHFNLLNIDVR